MCNEQRKPHKHAEVIKAWADGYKIQYRNGDSDNWRDCLEGPGWVSINQYRIKPEPKPDVDLYMRINVHCQPGSMYSKDSISKFICKDDSGLVKFIFDGETGKLKKAEVI